MKIKSSVFPIATIFVTLACSFLSNLPQSGPKEPPSSTQGSDTAPEINSQPIKPDDGLRYPISCGQQYGYINRQGNLIIPYQFEQAGFFYEDVAVVGGLGELKGYIDISGKYVIEPRFPEAASFSEGLAAAASPDDPNLYGYIDKTGQFVIEPIYFGSLPGFSQESPDFRDFHEGYAIVRNIRKTLADDWLFIYIDHNGNILTPPGPVKHATYFSDGLAIIQTDTETNIINKNGQTVASVVDCNYNNCQVSAFSEGLAQIKRNRSIRTLTGFIDASGKVVIIEQYDYAEPFSEGLSAVLDITTQLWGYINSSGTLVIPYQYTIAGNFSEGLAPVVLPDEISGYIDKTGNIVIPIDKMNLSDFGLFAASPGGIFRNGLALIGNTYINQKGEIVYRAESSACR